MQGNVYHTMGPFVTISLIHRNVCNIKSSCHINQMFKHNHFFDTLTCPAYDLHKSESASLDIMSSPECISIMDPTTLWIHYSFWSSSSTISSQLSASSSSSCWSPLPSFSFCNLSKMDRTYHNALKPFSIQPNPLEIDGKWKEQKTTSLLGTFTRMSPKFHKWLEYPPHMFVLQGSISSSLLETWGKGYSSKYFNKIEAFYYYWTFPDKNNFFDWSRVRIGSVCTLLPFSNDSSIMNRTSGVNLNCILFPNPALTYFVFAFRPSITSSLPLSSLYIDTYTFATYI